MTHQAKTPPLGRWTLPRARLWCPGALQLPWFLQTRPHPHQGAAHTRPPVKTAPVPVWRVTQHGARLPRTSRMPSFLGNSLCANSPQLKPDSLPGVDARLEVEGRCWVPCVPPCCACVGCGGGAMEVGWSNAPAQRLLGDVQVAGSVMCCGGARAGLLVEHDRRQVQAWRGGLGRWDKHSCVYPARYGCTLPAVVQRGTRSIARKAACGWRKPRCR